jgi:hypothetical protein
MFELLILTVMFFAALCSAPTSSAQASDVYVTPDGSGQGVCTSSPQTPAWFNSSGNWGTGASQIGPGTTVHLCGTFTGAAGATFFTFQAGGTSGKVITLKFETGAILQAPYLSSGGAINLGSHGFIVIDGGTNGLIQNTLNGTTGGRCPGGTCNQEQETLAITTTGGNVEIKNLTIGPLYSRVSGDPAPAGNIYTQIQCISFSGSNVLIHNNTLHDAGWCLQQNYRNDDNVQIYDNNIYGHDHGYAAAGADFTMQNVYFHDNHLHDFNNWDGSGGHHDGVHAFNGSGGRIVNFYSYNNEFDGQQGDTMTAWIFMEGNGSGTPWNGNNSSSNFYSWNDVFIGSEHDTNGMMGILGGQVHIYNDTIFGGGTGSGSVCLADFQSTGGSSVTIENSVLQNCNQIYDFDSGVSAVTAKNNVFGNAAGGNEIFHWQGHSSGSSNTLSAWQAACGCDSGSQGALGGLLANLSSTTGAPSTGFIGAGIGQNLMGTAAGSLATLADSTSAGDSRTPVKRLPMPTPWDVGAYALGGTSTAGPAAPTALTATIN